MNDAFLVDQIKEGSSEAREKFVRTHYESILRFAICLTRKQTDAEDITQQAFLRAIRKIHTFKGESSLRTWLHAILYREFTHWRRIPRPFGNLRKDHPAHGSPFEQVHEAAVLMNAMGTLDPIHRAVFVLHEVQGFEVTEIAGMLSIPEGTVKSRLFHARKQLKTKLESSMEESNGKPLLQSR